ncbi:MAG: hypothetical protein WC470_01485 [Candidatus Paceibacterota bacterium]
MVSEIFLFFVATINHLGSVILTGGILLKFGVIRLGDDTDVGAITSKKTGIICIGLSILIILIAAIFKAAAAQ